MKPKTKVEKKVIREKSPQQKEADIKNERLAKGEK
jgi:hypothetical protein